MDFMSAFKQFSGKGSQAGADLDDGHTIRQVRHFDRFFYDIPVGEEILSELFFRMVPQLTQNLRCFGRRQWHGESEFGEVVLILVLSFHARSPPDHWIS